MVTTEEWAYSLLNTLVDEETIREHFEEIADQGLLSIMLVKTQLPEDIRVKYERYFVESYLFETFLLTQKMEKEETIGFIQNRLEYLGHPVTKPLDLTALDKRTKYLVMKYLELNLQLPEEKE